MPYYTTKKCTMMLMCIDIMQKTVNNIQSVVPKDDALSMSAELRYLQKLIETDEYTEEYNNEEKGGE